MERYLDQYPAMERGQIKQQILAQLFSLRVQLNVELQRRWASYPSNQGGGDGLRIRIRPDIDPIRIRPAGKSNLIQIYFIFSLDIPIKYINVAIQILFLHNIIISWQLFG